MNKFKSVFLVFLITFCGSTQPQKKATTDSNWTKGDGVAQIYQQDNALARDRALREAKKDAVARKLGEMITSKSVVDSGVWVKGEVVAKSEGLVKDYQVLSERAGSDSYFISINAYVTESAVSNMVESLLSDWEKPVIFPIIDETITGTSKNKYDNSTIGAMSKFFNEKGFFIQKTSKWQKDLNKNSSYDPGYFMELSEKTTPDFELIFYGTSSCNNAGKVMNSNLLSGQANITLSVVDIHTGMLIASSTHNGAAAHLDINTACNQAIDRALTYVNEDIFKQMLSKWKKEYGNGKVIILEINGNLSYDNLYKLENDLRDNLRGVEDVLEKDIQNKKKVLHVVYKGQTKDFMQELVNKQLSVKLTVESRNGNKVITNTK